MLEISYHIKNLIKGYNIYIIWNMLLNIILNIYQNGKNQNLSYYKFDTKLYAYIIEDVQDIFPS